MASVKKKKILKGGKYICPFEFQARCSKDLSQLDGVCFQTLVGLQGLSDSFYFCLFLNPLLAPFLGSQSVMNLSPSFRQLGYLLQGAATLPASIHSTLVALYFGQGNLWQRVVKCCAVQIAVAFKHTVSW